MNNVLSIAVNGERLSHLATKLRSADIAVLEYHSIPDLQKQMLAREHRVCILRDHASSHSISEILSFIRQNSISIKLIVSVKSGTVEDAVRSIKAGAHDFIVGESFDARLVESVLRAVTDFRHSYFEHSTGSMTSTSGEAVLVGQSPAISEIRSAISLVAKSQTTVLVTGESGTGKEVVSRLLHMQSPRSARPFITINCAAMPKDVIENELFGHERGAFTGALMKKAGCFEMANSGTLMFDEIAEMSIDTQAKLLRAIETQTFRRLGGKDEVKVDVRMIAATNKNIPAALKAKELREDLYYRLSVVEIYIPPLRERKEDIGALVEYFMTMFSLKYCRPQQQFTDEAAEMLNAYDWPGNVREVRNVVERALVICPEEMIGPQYLPQRIHAQASTKGHIHIPVGCSTQEAERILILQTLASAGNNKAKAAKILGVSRKTLHNKLTSFSRISE